MQFNFGGFSISCPLKLLSIIIGATFKGKNMLPMRSIFFPLIVTPFKTWFLYGETYSTISKVDFDNTDTNILRVYVYLMLIV